MKIIKKENFGVQQVYNTNVDEVNNYVGNGVINHNCVIDEDYQGEISIHVYNRSNNDVTINPGDKLVQFINLPVIYSIPTEVDESELFDTITERGEGGFGSTGTR